MTTKVKHVILEYCYVCEQRFTDSVPPGPASREVHHVVPRNFGGTDGPTVTLCADHHNRVHAIALRLQSGKPHFDLLKGEPAKAATRLLELATVVYNAWAATKGDPNKPALVMLRLTGKQKAMVDRLKKVYPKCKSRESILYLALENMYRRNFGNE
ncbi:hypothetical protein H1O16_gp163 [Burkholderia phage BcepSaruman]|uniref:HNH endonuclease n=1 Tax=Burkholderia phage BcepSaruman TaxID=2530032 RepID=A0A4D5ZDE6_9CAUD|nr:hypothetical protein H1O16_gp163 [Burkholderia phage BcepSaruman]QBX06576.1 hypothetical protein BcepSaruman_163 [Burkholderia phage BcepSaruman]